jgi:hypothetical protein
MCQKCYATISTTLGRKAAQNRTRKVLTRCNECNIYICRDCFITYHKNNL